MVGAGENKKKRMYLVWSGWLTSIGSDKTKRMPRNNTFDPGGSKRENIRTAVGSWEISVWSGWEAR